MIDTEALKLLQEPQRKPSRFFGVMTGVVTDNQDPEQLHRVKVRFPWIGDEIVSHWARVAAPMAGNDRGAYFLPEPDDEVLLAFDQGDIHHPYVIGALWNGSDAPPEDNSDGENNHRTIRSRSGHILRFNDKAGGETIEIIDKTGKQSIVIDSASNTITIESQSDVTIESRTGKLKMRAVGVEIDSKAGVTIQAKQNVDVSASAQVNVKGAMINLN